MNQLSVSKDQPSSRISYIDTARGFGVILLILGHIVTGNSPLFNWIFSFHMPLFFFLSGMCVKEGSLGEPGQYIKKRAIKRLRPYFAITAFGFIVCMLIPSYREPIFADGMSLQLKHIFLLMEPRNLYIGQVWFLASLFWAELYFYLWYKLCHKRNLLIQISSLLIFLLLARHIWRIYPAIPLLHDMPFQIDTACMGAFCYIVGFLTRKYQLPERIRKYGWLFILPALILNIYFGTYSNGYVNMCNLVFGNMIYYTISMLLGLFVILMISVYFSPHIISWYGKYSLDLFALHTLLIYLVRECIYLITGQHYTMMGNVPNELAYIMTVCILILFFFIKKISSYIFQLFMSCSSQHS